MEPVTPASPPLPVWVAPSLTVSPLEPAEGGSMPPFDIPCDAAMGGMGGCTCC